MTGSEVLDLSISFAFVTLAVAIGVTFLRLLRGPTLLDRVVALDLLAFIPVALIAVMAIDSGQRALIDVAITVALTAVIGTVVFARFLEEEGRGD